MLVIGLVHLILSDCTRDLQSQVCTSLVAVQSVVKLACGTNGDKAMMQLSYVVRFFDHFVLVAFCHSNAAVQPLPCPL